MANQASPDEKKKNLFYLSMIIRKQINMKLCQIMYVLKMHLLYR